MKAALFYKVFSEKQSDQQKNEVRRRRATVLLIVAFFFTRIETAVAQGEEMPEWLADSSTAETPSPATPAVSELPVVSSYDKTFIISAYYSPLPGQERYVTGSYAGDIRLNGRGTNGADGTPVYPGMVASPKTYAFGTKMTIPGIGTVAVHDRGGAIVTSGARGNAYDRLDIWMGFGDKGLRRALQWGKRTVTVTVHGVDPTIQEQIALENYSDDERRAPVAKPAVASQTAPTSKAHAESEQVELTETFAVNLKLGDSGVQVRELQEELRRVHLLGIEPTGYYGEVTAHAVFKFQQIHKLAGEKDSLGAGVFGPKTRTALNAIVAARLRTEILVAEKDGQSM